MRDLLLDSIEIPGFQIYTTENGKRAKEIFDLNPQAIKLIIADIHTPELNGVALLIQIRQRSSIPVILITGDSSLDTNEIMKLGANAVLAKPFSIHKLIDTSLNCLSPHRSPGTAA